MLLCATQPTLDGSWPTKTVTQTVAPENCQPSPHYSCYVVHTTTLTAQIPQATIHMVLPQEEPRTGIEDKIEAMGFEAEGLEKVIEEMESMGFEADGFVVERVKLQTGSRPKMQNVITNPVQTITPTPTRNDPGLPLPTSEFVGPTCVHVKTETVTGPCPMVTPLPLNSEGCAIITSTAFAITTVTAVPIAEGPIKQQQSFETTVTYSISTPEETDGDGSSKKRKYHPKTHHLEHHSKFTAILDPMPPATAASQAIPMTTTPPVAHDEDVLLPPGEVKKQVFETTWSTHVSYTLSFDFTYGTPSASPIPAPSPALLELPAPPAITITATPAPEPADVAASPSQPIPYHQPTRPLSSDDLTPSPGPAVDPPTPPSSEENPNIVEYNEIPGGTNDPPVSIDSPPLEDSSTIVVNPPLPTTLLSPLVSTDEKTKACPTCPEPCLVELDVTAQAEIPLLRALFESKIQKAFVSLKITLQNEMSLSGPAKTTTTTTPEIDLHTLDLYERTVDEQCARLEAEYLAKLQSRCEKVVRQDCYTGECLQRKVDKVIPLLDVMLSSELANDASRLRTEILKNFKKKLDQQHLPDDKIEKQGGLLGSLLGDSLGGALDRTVESLTGRIDQNVVKPLLGHDLLQPLIQGLTDSVKKVVDSFVHNCNQKGLLDFDTEKGVGTLEAITNVSLDLFKIVCVKANVDSKVSV